MKYNVFFKAATSQAAVLADGEAGPTDFTNIGDFIHPTEAPSIDLLGVETSHTIYDHVKDVLYTQGITDFSHYPYDLDSVCNVASIDVTPATVTKTIGQTQQLTITILPTQSVDKTVTFHSSDATKATVSTTGLVTAIASGSATITVTTHDGGFTDTCVVTIPG